MKIFRRALSIFLALTMLLVIPYDVLANLQNAVISFSIVDWTPRGGDAYSLELQWRRPVTSTLEDSAADGNDKTDRHNPDGYDIYYRNASKSESYPAGAANYNVTADRNTGIPDPVNLRLDNTELDSGSLYSFMVNPYHTHSYLTVDPSGNDVWETRPTQLSGTNAEAIYLTDIKLTGNGNGNKMTLVWDNPKFDGAQVFTGYRISYEAGGSSIDKIRDIPPVTVQMGDPGMTIRADGKIEYTITDENLKIATFYAVKVEPLIGNTLFRTMNSVTINNKIYNVAYPSMDREYRTNESYISPSLYIEPQGSDLLKLYWDTLKSLNSVTEILVQSCPNEDFSIPTTIGTLTGDAASSVTHWLTAMPATKTYYRLMISYLDEVTGSLITRPTLIVSYDPTYNDFTPYKPTILEYSSMNDPLTLEIKWEAFTREAYNPGEESAKNKDINKYVDKDIEYDIWISDNLAALDNSIFQGYSVLTLDAKMLAELPYPNQYEIEKLCYSYPFTEYYALNSDNTIEKRPLELNKIYYVKILARRTNDSGQVSQAAYSSYYLQAEGEVSPIPQMAAKPPLRVKKDEDGILMVDTSSITIEWDTRWFEAYNEADKTWYSQIGWDESGNILFGEAAMGNNQQDLFDRRYTDIINELVVDPTGTLRNILSGVQGAPINAIDTLPLRYIDLKDANYEIHVVEYDKMVEAGGSYDQYYQTLVNNPSLWAQQIAPDTGSDPLHPFYQVTVCDNPSGNLKNNTAYVIFFRPYVMIDGKKSAWFPNYVNATTRDVRDPLVIVPTVPNLIPEAQTDSSLEVKWEYTSSLMYEMAYGETLSEYPDNGTPISYEQILKYGVPFKDPETGISYYKYTIDSLFPDTPYYVWIRSYADNNEVITYSQWSNPILMNTTELLPPDPPKGLGLVSKDNLDAYNAENNLDLTRLGVNHMIIEWMKDYNDRSVNSESDEFLEVLLSLSYNDSYVALVEGLEPNTEYYTRIKTILTVSRNDDGFSERSYNYFVEVSSDPYFEDKEKIRSGYVPELKKAEPDPYNDIRKESGWCTPLVIKTGKSTDEYDSDVDFKTYPLPVQDFEVLFDQGTGTLSLRFRTNQIDSAGNHDNNVDQRFISSLIANQTSIYALDLSSYNNQPLSARVVELPYSIVKTFDDRKIPFQVNAGGITVAFMPGSFNTGEVLDLKDYGKDAYVRYTISQNPGNAPVLSANEDYTCNPQRVSVQVITPTRTVSLTNLSNPMQISLETDGRYSALDRNIGAYASDSNSGGWQRINADYNAFGGTFSFSTNKLGNYSAIARQLPQDNDLAVQSDASYNIMTRLDIPDLKSYKGSDYITANQLNNLIAAIAKNSFSLNINDDLSGEDNASLSKAGFLLSGTHVQRQAAMNALVRLYELKTKSAIKSFPDQRSSPYKDIALADQGYQEALLKAGDLGFFGSSNDANPRSLLTISDALYIIDIIMGDSGM